MNLDGIAELDAYIRSTSQNTLACQRDPYKGRITVAQKAIKAGAPVLSERKLASVIVPEDNWLYKKFLVWHKEDEWELLPLWTWAACAMILSVEEAVELESLSKTDPYAKALLSLPLPRFSASVKNKLQMLFSPPLNAQGGSTDIESCAVRLDQVLKDSSGADGEVTKPVKDLIAPRVLQQYANLWIFNCFEGNSDPLEFVTYFAPAFCSHSCLPNTLWHTNDDVFTLLARRDINVDEEISFTYTSDGHLLEPTADRRQDLEVTKYFKCLCDRCSFPVDLSRGFRCQACLKGQWFFGPEEPFLSDDQVDDVECWLDIEHDDTHDEEAEFSQLESYVSAISIESLYQVLEPCRGSNELAEYINESFKPCICCKCGAAPTPHDVLRAKTIEYLLNLLTFKEAGEERYLLESVTDFWHRELSGELSSPRSSQEWWDQISFDSRLLPSILRYVGQNVVLLSIFEWRKSDILQTKGSLRLALIYTEAKHILVTQMCPIYTGFIAWTSADIVELRCSWYAEDLAQRLLQLKTDEYLWKHVEIALKAGSTIFGEGAFTQDIKKLMSEALKPLMGEENREFIEAKIADLNFELCADPIVAVTAKS